MNKKLICIAPLLGVILVLATTAVLVHFSQTTSLGIVLNTAGILAAYAVLVLLEKPLRTITVDQVIYLLLASTLPLLIVTVYANRFEHTFVWSDMIRFKEVGPSILLVLLVVGGVLFLLQHMYQTLCWIASACFTMYLYSDGNVWTTPVLALALAVPIALVGLVMYFIVIGRSLRSI